MAGNAPESSKLVKLSQWNGPCGMDVLVCRPRNLPAVAPAADYTAMDRSE